MKKQLVYDLPTRIFHWLFAGFFLTAFVIAQTVDDESPVFSYHMLFGILLGFVVLVRILWGFIGTTHARFSHFALKPADLVTYLKGILTGDKRRWAGHNPASSWAAILMMMMALGLGATGYLMSTGYKETFEDLHELLANGFIVVVILHVAGIVLHSVRHQEMLAMSMLDGKKAGVPYGQTIRSSKPAVGVLMVGLVVAFGLHLFKNYDKQTQTLQMFGATLNLGDSEGGHGFEHEGGDDD